MSNLNHINHFGMYVITSGMPESSRLDPSWFCNEGAYSESLIGDCVYSLF